MLYRIMTTLMFAVLVPLSGTAADGSATYAAQCAKCHGATGKADTPVAKAMKVPAIAGSHSADQLKAALQEKKQHAPIKDKVSDEDLAAIAEFLGTLAGS